MDSVGDYIYLIIIAIAAISGIFKKKKPQTVIQNPESESYDEEEEIYADLSEEKIEEKYKKYEGNFQTLSYETATDFSKIKAKKQPVMTSKFSNTNELATLPIEELTESEYKFDSLDDVKRAVIYSEIFNRKY